MKQARKYAPILLFLFLSIDSYSQNQLITKLYQELFAKIERDGIAVQYYSPKKNIRASSIILVLDDYLTWSINTINGKRDVDIFAFFIKLDAKHQYELKFVRGIRDLAKGFTLEVYYSRGTKDIVQKRFEIADVIEAFNHFLVGTPMKRKNVASSYLEKYVDSGWFD